MSTQPDSNFTFSQRDEAVRAVSRCGGQLWQISIILMIGCAVIVCAFGVNLAKDSPESNQTGANANVAVDLRSDAAASIKNFLQKYCIECHSATSSEGDVNLD